MSSYKTNTKNFLKFPLMLAGVFTVAGVAFMFRRSFIGNVKEQTDSWYKSEDTAGQELLKAAIGESWTAEREKKLV